MKNDQSSNALPPPPLPSTFPRTRTAPASLNPQRTDSLASIPGDVEQMSSTIEDYSLQAPVGYGSSATVYCAVYLPTGRRVAIKVIDLDMFERNQIEELRVMSLCKHPNILPVYHSFVAASKLYIVTPYLAAGSCLDIMKTAFQDGLDEISIATILKQVLQGLDYLHKNGNIHRDVKAGNIILDDDGTVLLADFGVTASLEGVDRRNQRKTFVGTPCWMAPEVMEQTGYDFKADIWSFGITALELATGHAPLAKYPPIKVLMLTLSNEPPTLDRDSTKHKYSKTFKEMIDACLQKAPNKRPTAEKLLQHAFFKTSKKKIWLVSNLLQGLAPLVQRQRKRPTETPQLFQHGVSWDFDHAATSDESIESGEPQTAAADSEPVSIQAQSQLPMHNLSISPASIGNAPGMSPPQPSSMPAAPPQALSTTAPGTPGGAAEVRKGRFSVSEGLNAPAPSSEHPSLPNSNTPPERKGRPDGAPPLPATPATHPESQTPPAQQQPSQQTTSRRGRFEVSNVSEPQESATVPFVSPPSTINRNTSLRRETSVSSTATPMISRANSVVLDQPAPAIDRIYRDMDSLQRKTDEGLRLLHALAGRQTATAASPSPDVGVSPHIKDTIALLASQITSLHADNEMLRHENEALKRELEALKSAASPRQ
ncbi:hypothetical protein RI367_001345 [Sorochytrium milnesiophthora]